jgi:hypothetical protein
MKVTLSTSLKVAGSRPQEVIFFLIYLILPAALGPRVYSASDRNECGDEMEIITIISISFSNKKQL